MSALKVLYDGWSLLRKPLSPQAIHLLTILENLPLEVEPVFAFPGEPGFGIDTDAKTIVVPTGDSPKDQLRWEQKIIPSIARDNHAHLLHLTTATPPLFCRIPVLISPSAAEQPEKSSGGFIQRWKSALSAGAAQVRSVALLPEGFPEPKTQSPLFRIPLFDHSAFTSMDEISPVEIDLPEDFILYNGPSDEASLHRLLSTWRWAVGSFGDDHSLVILNMDIAGKKWITDFSMDSGMEGTIQYHNTGTIDQTAVIYRQSYLLLHPVPGIPWADPVHHAMAAGKPVVGIEHPTIDYAVGAAAYLAPPDNTRALGAALLTSIVDESVYETMIKAAGEKAKGMARADIHSAMLKVYQIVTESKLD